VLPVPDGMDLRTAAAIPETWITAYQLLAVVGHAKAGETVLVHAAGERDGRRSDGSDVKAGDRRVRAPHTA